MTSIDEIIEEAKKLVEPSLEEKERRLSIVRKIIEIVDNGLRARGLQNFEVSLQGSLAKDTWLPENKDIDVFIILSKDNPREVLRELVKMLIEIAEENKIEWRLKYAQHPYVQYIVSGYEIDIVPCYRIEPGERPITAADRTPLHTRYVISKLLENPHLKTEIRLFKRFLKIVGIYGAEIKVEGFSGYLAEVLTIYYGSFKNLLRDVAENWRPGKVVIDPEKHYADPRKARTLFKDAPLIVIDPVDPMRNAAAAVSLRSMCKLILAGKLFLDKPSLKFFKYPEKPINIEDLKGRLIPPTLLIVLPYPEKTSPETVWGEIKRLCKSLRNTLERYEYKVYDSEAWTDEKSVITVAIMVEKDELPEYELHKGPPVYSDNVLKFVEKYVNDNECLGPYVIGERVVVIKRRKYNTVEKLVRAQICQIAPKHMRKLCEKANIIIVRDLDDVARLPETIRDFTIRFIIKREHWL
ncbi:MAG: CCA tRNA nucleotidyltransferase [Crenarchaeota archaeon]|nr:CCA tRNA nucleotidyltransferase [Thermoproteota archaeon]